MALTIRGSSLTSRLTVRLSTRRTTTKRAADDDAAGCVGVAPRRLGSALRAFERDVCREQLIDGVRHTVGLPERGDREPRTTNVADHGHDLDRVPICVLLVPFAEERSAARGGRSGCAIDPMIRWEPRDGWAGGLVLSFAQVGQLARRM